MLLLMAIYWITETFHLSVTSLIPLVLSPMLSLQTAPDVAKNYFKVGILASGVSAIIYLFTLLIDE